jgi:hypothetical protein
LDDGRVREDWRRRQNIHAIQSPGRGCCLNLVNLSCEPFVCVWTIDWELCPEDGTFQIELLHTLLIFNDMQLQNCGRNFLTSANLPSGLFTLHTVLRVKFHEIDGVWWAK